ncbi:energy transducer TonB [Sphingomonas immobilis]|uniref:Protein TonB n=1 Tax=Sphingomonas immobilis TaxID=3063997 RepID=A0ABT8ZVX6_9SPHN|nr:energy transducer TonB [Sphingomonas sp. CA1-15]MDO7841367.1 energy transducer TonB [Sphingomonas sp. CA1-15]
MYADRYARRRIEPGSFAMALAVNGAILTGLVFFVNPNVSRHIETILTATAIPVEPPKSDPVPPKPIPQPRADDPLPRQAPEVSRTPIDLQPIDFGHSEPPPFTPVDLGNGGGGGTIPIEPIKPLPPVIVQPAIKDMANFQPVYPADERRAGNGGRVEVRVLVGVDGRVKDIERISATSDSFFEVTRRRALEKWRFTPATRDGIPFETWRRIGVSFVLNEDQ